MALEATTQTVIVTAATAGIGQSIAIAFGKQKANVIINYHSDEEGANKTLKDIKKAGGNGFIHKADVGKEEEVVSMFQRAIRGFVDNG
jgi:glucose 1-dehydrogenase